MIARVVAGTLPHWRPRGLTLVGATSLGIVSCLYLQV